MTTVALPSLTHLDRVRDSHIFSVNSCFPAR